MNSIVIGSRGSPLALAQTNSIADRLRRLQPALAVAVKVIKTTGDRFATSPLTTLAGDTKGLFVKEIEEELLAGSIDLAVHSLKDVPTDLPTGLCLGAIPEREEPWDALVCEDLISSLSELPRGAKVGTSSLRRRLQLLARRPDLEIVPVRGNIDTRIRKLREGQLDGIVLAAAGLCRLNLGDRISYRFPIEEMVPAIGQGCLALEIREDNDPVLEVIKDLDHSTTRRCVSAERIFLERMGGGCQVPIGAYAVSNPKQSRFVAFLASPSGVRTISHTFLGGPGALEKLVEEAVDSFRAQGSDSLLREVEI